MTTYGELTNEQLIELSIMATGPRHKPWEVYRFPDVIRVRSGLTAVYFFEKDEFTHYGGFIRHEFEEKPAHVFNVWQIVAQCKAWGLECI